MNFHDPFAAGNAPSLLVLVCLLFPFMIEFVSQLLQRSWIGRKVPDELKDIYEESEYNTSNAYTKEKSTYGLVKDVWDQILFIAFWFVGGFGMLQEYTNGLGLSEPVAGLAFFGILSVAEQILSIPWSLYNTFVLEEKYGFNNTTAKTFIMDRVKGIALMVVLGAPILFLVLFFFKNCGTNAWLYAWITLAVFQVTLFFLAPVLLLPLFLQMIPLPDGTAILIDGLDKAGAYKFLNRIFYEVLDTKHNGKPVWTTRDRRFAGAEKGDTLCLYSGDDKTWVIADGAMKDGVVLKDNIAATSKESPAGPQLISVGAWSLVSAGDAEAAAASPLLESKDKMRVKEAQVGELKKKLMALAEQLNYKNSKLFVIDGSTRSEHSNAFCTGFGEFRRICLFDTLFAHMTNDEITAVLGHEIGHDKLNHTISRLFLGLVLSFVQFFMLGQFIHSPFLAEAFFLDVPTVYTGMLLFFMIWGVVEFFLSIPMTVKSRMDEYSADRFAVEADITYGVHLGEGLKKLMKNSKSNLTPHPFYVFLHHSHPPLMPRLEAIEAHHAKTWTNKVP